MTKQDLVSKMADDAGISKKLQKTLLNHLQMGLKKVWETKKVYHWLALELLVFLKEAHVRVAIPKREKPFKFRQEQFRLLKPAKLLKKL